MRTFSGHNEYFNAMKKWVRSGLVWAGILYVITMVVFPLFDHESFSIEKLLMGIPLWIIVGLALGFLFEKKGKSKSTKKKTAKP